MTDIKSVNAPSIGQAGIKRLYEFVREERMKAEGGAFQAGYEQAKRDFRDRLKQEVAIPAEQSRIHPVDPKEETARYKAAAKTGWWHGVFS